MTDQELMREYDWKSVCKQDCYSPWPHTHEFNRDKLPEKSCPNCANEMVLDAQCRQTELGKNRRTLLNCYECKNCDTTDEIEIQLS